MCCVWKRASRLLRATCPNLDVLCVETQTSKTSRLLRAKCESQKLEIPGKHTNLDCDNYSTRIALS